MEENKDLRQDETTLDEGSQANKETVTEEEKKTEEATKVEKTEETPSETEAPLVHDLSAQKGEEPDRIDGEYHPNNAPRENVPGVFNPVRYHNDQTHTIDEDLESVRKSYAHRIGKANLVNIASLVIMLVAFVAVLLVALLNTGDAEGENSTAWITWVVFGIAIALIVASFLISHFVMKKTTKVNIEYLGAYQDTLGGYLAENLSITDPLFSTEAKIDDQAVIQAHYFKTINAISSRCVLQGTRHGHEIQTGELLVIMPDKSFEECNKKPENLKNIDGTAYVPETTGTTTSTQELPANDMTMLNLDLTDQLHGKEKEKREREERKARNKESHRPTSTRNGLFGRFYSYRLRIDPEESFILCFTGNKENTVLPDYVDTFTPTHIPGLKKNIVVYLAEPGKSAKFFDERGVELLNAITIDSVVESVFLSANSYGVKVGMNLSDDIMELPMKKAIKRDCVDSFVTASANLFRFVDHVEEKATVLSDEN